MDIKEAFFEIDCKGSFLEYLQNLVSTFQQALCTKGSCLPVDLLISRKKMRKRIERCCLCFELPERIVKALRDLKDLGEWVECALPTLPRIAGLTQKSLRLKFDVDHLFLLDYTLRDGCVVELSGLHVDFEGEIEQLAQCQPRRIKVHNHVEDKYGVRKVRYELDSCFSKYKTLFPHNWSWRRCLISYKEALANVIKIVARDDGTIKLVGLSEANISIEIIIDPKQERVVTFYPKIEKSGGIFKSKIWQITRKEITW